MHKYASKVDDGTKRCLPFASNLVTTDHASSIAPIPADLPPAAAPVAISSHGKSSSDHRVLTTPNQGRIPNASVLKEKILREKIFNMRRAPK